MSFYKEVCSKLRKEYILLTSVLLRVMYVVQKKGICMIEKDYQLYGTKILNLKTKEIGLLICIWKNKFADGEVDFATCVNKQGKRYNIELDNIRGFEDDFEK